MKVVDGEEPIVLLGADLMAPARLARGETWEFESIGIESKSKAGYMCFVWGGKARKVKLLAWPVSRPGPS